MNKKIIFQMVFVICLFNFSLDPSLYNILYNKKVYSIIISILCSSFEDIKSKNLYFSKIILRQLKIIIYLKFLPQLIKKL